MTWTDEIRGSATVASCFETRNGRIWLDKPTVGGLLRAKRKLLGMRQNRFADHLEITPHKLAIWEMGRNKPSSDWYIVHDMTWLRLFLRKVEADRIQLTEELARAQRAVRALQIQLDRRYGPRIDPKVMERERRTEITRRMWRQTRALRKQLHEYEKQLDRQAQVKIHEIVWDEFAAWWRERALARAPDQSDLAIWVRQNQSGYANAVKTIWKAHGVKARKLGEVRPVIAAIGKGRKRTKNERISTPQSRAWENGPGKLGVQQQKQRIENAKRIEELRRAERERIEAERQSER